ncbi:efflux RND transporter permease subunit [Candidatus Palauibacter sp.]|uniref:efflux RND transporter permease subunit n=1 Tax=Candidatus Palauibacter sp. TaxID=3101350 RepID=UPI003B51C9C1
MSTGNSLSGEQRGPIAYMVRNGVAANLLMLFILVGGLVSLNGLVQEAFPALSFNHIEISMSYPGATPQEVEESVVLKIEERVAALDGVREVTAVAAEGYATVMVGLRRGTDATRALDDIGSAVNSIQNFPARAERPEVREMTNRQSVIRLVLYGDVSERALKQLAYRIEDDLASLPVVSYVETSGVRRYEISIEVPLRQLRAAGLTIEDISDVVRRGSLDLSAGSMETPHAEVLVRTVGQRYDQQDFEDIIVLSKPDGTAVRLGDIAEVRDGFQNVDLITRYDGRRAAFVEVYRTSGEQVLDVVRAVEEHLDREVIPSLPPGLSIEILNNDAEVYESRLHLLLENGLLGLLLVLVALALFLDIRLAIWVALGIAVSFIGALAGALVLGISINTVTLFGFLIAVGIVVDDAIVVAEHVHAERHRGVSAVLAAIRGAKRIKRPVVFAVLTTVAAFAPLLFVPGPLGSVFASLALILICILLFSLIESFFILPNHLSHLSGPGWQPANSASRFLARVQSSVDRGLNWFVEVPLDRALRAATGRPAIVIAAGIGMIILSVSLVASGVVGFIFTEPVQSDIVTASLEMPEGTPVRRTAELADDIEAAGRRAIERLSRDRPADAPPLLLGVNSTVGMRARQLGGPIVQQPSLRPQGHIASVEFKLLEAEQRDIRSAAFAQAWREEAGAIPEARALVFTADLLNLGPPVQVDLSHPDPDRLGAIGDAVVARLSGFEGLFDIQSDHVAGLQEIQIELRPEAQALGVTLDGLARQVRSAFFGSEVLRVQRGREDVRVYARLPEEERDGIADVERYPVRTSADSYAPLSRVATVLPGRSHSSIRRKNGRRVVTVSADLDPAVITGGEVGRLLEDTILPELANLYPGLDYSLGGEQQQQAESVDSVGRAFVLALLAIYALLAIPLRSYTKPLIVMAAIPFGIIGAILGHLIMGLSLSATSSMFGVIGLSGVVVNDSLVMLDFIDERAESSPSFRDAVIDGAKGRFRPILLTSVTTFLGFAPLIFERSVQAQFLAPLGVSLGFGIIFATVILMLIVPALAMVYFNVQGAGDSRRTSVRQLPTSLRPTSVPLS